jgi:hypothetical protein
MPDGRIPGYFSAPEFESEEPCGSAVRKANTVAVHITTGRLNYLSHHSLVVTIVAGASHDNSNCGSRSVISYAAESRFFFAFHKSFA